MPGFPYQPHAHIIADFAERLSHRELISQIARHERGKRKLLPYLAAFVASGLIAVFTMLQLGRLDGNERWAMAFFGPAAVLVLAVLHHIGQSDLYARALELKNRKRPFNPGNG